MTQEQYRLSLQLLALFEDDQEGQANCCTYGNWLDHLADQCSDHYQESLK